MLSPAYGVSEHRLSSLPEPRHDVVRPVALPDLRQPLIDGEVLTVWASRHVRVPECIRSRRLFARELIGQSLSQTPLVCLVDSAGVVGDQSRNTTCKAPPSKPSCTVQRVETCIGDIWGVPDVVQPGSSHQHVRVVSDKVRKPFRLGRHCLHMQPATR